MINPHATLNCNSVALGVTLLFSIDSWYRNVLVMNKNKDTNK